MRKLIIAILLLTGFTAQSQTKWRQIERSLTKWNVPAAYDSIPGQTGYAGKWVALTTLLDTLGIDSLGNFTIIDSTIIYGGFGMQVTESPSNTFTLDIDSSKVATAYDLTLVDQSITNEIQIIDTFQVFDTNKLRISLSQDGQAAKFVTIPSPVDSTQILAGYGLIVNESPSNTWNISADSSKLATQYDLTDCLKGSGVTNRIALWSADTLTSNGNLTFTSGNLFNLIGRMIIKATTTVGDWNAFINGGNTTLTGNNNIAIGNNQTLQSITTGDNNISLGSVSGLNLTTGDDNVFVGASAGRGNTTGSSNTYIGTISGFTNNGDANTFIGIGAGAIASNVTTNTYVGAYAGYTASNSSNVYLGFYSGFASSNSGSNNVAVGNESSNNGGGSNNVKIGATSGKTNTGSNNVFVGYDSGQASSSKGGNVFIGYQSGRNEDIDNSLIIANSSSTSNGIYGDFDNSKFGVNIAPSSAARTWDVNGELRVRDLTTDNPTKMLGADNDGDVSGVNVGVGLTLSGTTLTADTSKLATPYDLSLMDQSATNEIQTIDTFQIFDTNKLRISLSQDNQAAKVVTLPNGTGTNLTLTGSASPFTLNSDTGTDVTFKQGYGILLTRNSNELTIESLFEVPETWQSYTTFIHNWDATGLFGSGKDVGIGGQPSRDFDVIGLSRFRGAVYDSTNTSGTTGQVMTSKGSNAWSWATPADASATNELQTISTSGAAGNITLSNGGGTLNLNVNDADASTTNELQTLSHTSDATTHTTTLSNSGGSLILTQGDGINLTTSSNNVTIVNTIQRGASELSRTNDLNNASVGTTPVKMDFNTGTQINNGKTSFNTSTDRITLLSTMTASTIIRITYNGYFTTNQAQHVIFQVYKNGSPLTYEGITKVYPDDANYQEPTAYSKSFFLQGQPDDYYELYYYSPTGSTANIDFKSVAFNIEILN